MASAAPIGGEFHFREAVRVLATITSLGLDQESAEREVTAVLVHAVLAQRHRASTGLARSTPRDGADRHLTDTPQAAHSPQRIA
jgi:hypothetical protein